MKLQRFGKMYEIDVTLQSYLTVHCAESDDISEHNVSNVSTSHRIGPPEESLANFLEFSGSRFPRSIHFQLPPVSQESIWHLKTTKTSLSSNFTLIYFV